MQVHSIVSANEWKDKYSSTHNLGSLLFRLVISVCCCPESILEELSVKPSTPGGGAKCDSLWWVSDTPLWGFCLISERGLCCVEGIGIASQAELHKQHAGTPARTALWF